MAKAAPAITAFNGGEWSPLMFGRTDIKYYGSSCRAMQNFIPTPQGPARFRPGFRYVADVKNHSHREWLHKFEFNVEQAYQLEFGDYFIRFFSNHGQVESAPGVPLEVVTPYPVAALTAEDGTFNLRFAQSGDVIYVCHPDYPVYKLSRTGASSFTFTKAVFVAGPFDDVDPAQTITVYASGRTGTVTLTASSAIFAAHRVGTQIYVENKKANAIKQWESAKAVAVDALRRSDGKTYKALNAATTGNTKPIHSIGAMYDGDSGVQWEYQDAGYGWAEITAVAADGLSATATVLSPLPFGTVTSDQATTRWAFGAWNSQDGYPTDVTFFRGRLVFFRNKAGWTSVAASYDDFSRKDTGGVVTADMSVVFEVASDRSNRIEWAEESDTGLMIGTAGDEHVLTENTSNEAFGPNNRRVRKQSDHGSKHVKPVRVGEGVLYVQKSGRKVRDCVMAESVNERWVSSDTTVLAEHITAGGVICLAYQQEPDSVVWGARADGLLVGFTLNRQQDVRGWHRHPVGGVDAKVESLVVTPAPSGDMDELWAIVSRTVNGSTRRTIEYMEKQVDTDGDQLDGFYVDSGLTYYGPPVATLSGLDHLEGETVAVMVDGSAHPNRVVVDGSITLRPPISDLPTTKVHVGLPYIGLLSPMPLDAGGADGTSQGKIQRITKVGIRFYLTGAARFGRDATSQLDKIELRGGGDKMDVATPLFTGDKVVAWPDGYDSDGRMTIVQDLPQPCNVVAVFPHVVTQDSPGSKNR